MIQTSRFNLWSPRKGVKVVLELAENTQQQWERSAEQIVVSFYFLQTQSYLHFPSDLEL